MLVHHAHAGSQRQARVPAGKRPSLDHYAAGVGDIMTEEDVDERALSRAVLAEERHDLAAPDRERDVVVGYQRAEPLGDAAQFEQRSGSAVRRRTSHILRR